MSEESLLRGIISDDDLALLQLRIGTPNPTLRAGLSAEPWNPAVTSLAVRRWAISIGDDNPLFVDPERARASRWGGTIAPPGFEWSMGWNRSPEVSPELHAATRKALRGVQLFHSGAEYFYYRPLTEGTELYKSEWLADAVEKKSKFANRTVITTNDNAYWDREERVCIASNRWFVHAERRPVSSDAARSSRQPHTPTHYSDEQLQEIEQAYDNQFLRGSEALYMEDVVVGDATPLMVKGPLTVTDMINMHMGAGWITYTNPPYRLAFENRKRLRGFYSRNEFGAWDTIQRVHWDPELAASVGVKGIYDIGPMRFVMMCHYLTNYAGDDAFIHRIRYELRSFNYVGDTSWLSGRIVRAEVDEKLGPVIELEVVSVNQRGEENLRGSATILVPSRAHGPVRLPEAPPMPRYRSDKPTTPGL
ncbi:hypothetical protein ASE00_13475 [Sphingomonas sp. Root710]|uniref:FAS1-like dehydratase domain-containing protein n=1 Tax=Sphingomonas sp. Root710 TaxID=1736594 RepID=UPI0006F427B5|nr:MaoC family dehydratase N-terminal domain-containing protein [Sphingomonas sp. Root710]KRB82995.1 hypothetical protein ASE00_13475 [Sphingomonas sp. Root710]